MDVCSRACLFGFSFASAVEMKLGSAHKHLPEALSLSFLFRRSYLGEYVV